MQKLLDGIHQFQREIFKTRENLFHKLKAGQFPEVLFITCSDSRLSPNLLTQSAPGDLFILRNAGNIVPPYGSASGGEAATVEFAVEVLGVRDIIVCGHSHCGAMSALLEPGSVAHLPALTAWMQLAEPTRRLIAERYAHLDRDAQLNVATQEHVLHQLDTLRTHPVVERALAAGRLNLHGWVYKFETGAVFSYDPLPGQFLPLRAAGYRPSV